MWKLNWLRPVVDSRTPTEICGILALLNRDYWNRVWIIQEVFKARKITIYCGYETLSWNYLVKFFRMLRQSKQLSQFEKELVALADNPTVNLMNHQTSRAQDLETLLLVYLGSLCCDPRDKIYAVLGLAQAWL
ncbi:hypothetical protein BDZ45DRAFT_778174 [Acephala macrosclerotiorum]|nr:hypothetical protein BDZ45DRAFT_778174 [Acephala macrosclerotiorum]